MTTVITRDQVVRAGYTDVRVYVGGKADWYAAALPMERTAVVG